MSDSYSGSDNLEVMLEAVNYNNYLKDMVRRHAGDARRILDFGAGIGTFTDSLALEPSSIHCVEPDIESRTLLASKGYEVYSDLSEVDGAFDYIFTLNVLEHLDDDLAAARQLYNLLREGGVLFAFVPAFQHLWTSMDNLVSHRRRYTRTSLGRLVLQAGFDVEEIRYADFMGYFATLVFKMLDLFRKAPDGRLNKPLLIFYDRVVFPLSRLLSILFGRVLGKNVYVVARKPGVRFSR